MGGNAGQRSFLFFGCVPKAWSKLELFALPPRNWSVFLARFPNHLVIQAVLGAEKQYHNSELCG
eukprot:1052610-Rhodomonas_salina.1